MVTVSDFILRFGKHKGHPLREVPMSYLEWCLESNAGGPDAQAAIAAHLGVYVHPATAQKPTAVQEGRGKRPIHQQSHQPKQTPKQSSVDTTFHDATHHFNPSHEWEGRQEWDGETPPWLDQNDGQMDDEFRSLFT